MVYDNEVFTCNGEHYVIELLMLQYKPNYYISSAATFMLNHKH
jgi:hypothetical protein